jgi:putative PIN family toxin of toxin-antitoxin system
VKAAVDTNIWISSLIATSETSTNLVDEWRKGKFIVAISEQQIFELYEVLARPKFLFKYHIKREKIEELVVLIKDKAERVTLIGSVTLCRDPDDNIIIETAVRGKAKYLITGDKDITEDKKVSSFLSRHGVTIISLSKFLELINKN